MTGIDIFDWDQHGRKIRQFYLAIDPATNGHKSAKSGIVGYLAMPTIPLLLRAWGLTINMDTFSTFIIVISLFVLFVFKYRIKNAEL